MNNCLQPCPTYSPLVLSHHHHHQYIRCHSKVVNQKIASIQLQLSFNNSITVCIACIAPLTWYWLLSSQCINGDRILSWISHMCDGDAIKYLSCHSTYLISVFVNVFKAAESIVEILIKGLNTAQKQNYLILLCAQSSTTNYIDINNPVNYKWTKVAPIQNTSHKHDSFNPLKTVTSVVMLCLY